MAEVPSSAVAAFGTVLKMKGEGSTYERLGDITGIGVPGFDTEILDATHQESPGRMREKIGGLLDPGEISGTLRFVPGSPQIEKLYAAAGTLQQWKIEFPDELPAALFKGVLKSFVPSEAEMSGLLEGTITISVSGPMTWEEPAP